MGIDVRPEPKWTAVLPCGRRTRLRLARGVRLCVGDILRVRRHVYTVVRRETVGEGEDRGFLVELAPAV